MTVCVGSPSDYELSMGENGWRIEKYIGFGEADFTVPNLIDGKQITEIGSFAFQGCRGIDDLRIAEGIQRISSHAFESCLDLKTVVMEDGVRYIEDGAFTRCKVLHSVRFPSTLLQIGSTFEPSKNMYLCGAFEETAIKKVDIPNSVTKMGIRTFSSCESLVSAKLSDNTQYLPFWLFRKCTKLNEVHLPQKLVTIGEYAFSECSSLKRVDIPTGTKSIKSAAFADCPLDTISIPDTVTEIGPNDNTIYHTLGNCQTVFCSPGSVAMEFARSHAIRCQRLEASTHE